jgi:hypothetical protein
VRLAARPVTFLTVTRLDFEWKVIPTLEVGEAFLTSQVIGIFNSSEKRENYVNAKSQLATHDAAELLNRQRYAKGGLMLASSSVLAFPVDIIVPRRK